MVDTVGLCIVGVMHLWHALEIVVGVFDKEYVKGTYPNTRIPEYYPNIYPGFRPEYDQHSQVWYWARVLKRSVLAV